MAGVLDLPAGEAGGLDHEETAAASTSCGADCDVSLAAVIDRDVDGADGLTRHQSSVARLVKSQSAPPFWVTHTSFGPVMAPAPAGTVPSVVTAQKLGLSGAMATWYTWRVRRSTGKPERRIRHPTWDHGLTPAIWTMTRIWPLVLDHLNRLIGPNGQYVSRRVFIHYGDVL